MATPGTAAKASRWRIPGVVAALLALVVGVTVVVARQAGDDERKPVSDKHKSVSVTPEKSASSRSSSPDDGPPYAAVPEFSSPSARDTAFVGDVARFTTWPSGTVSYGVMSSAPGGSDVSDFRAAVVKDARAVCGALADGTDMNDVPDAVGLPLTDPIDQAAFIVEAVTFYCPDQTAAVTDGVYSKPVPTQQREDCPAATALKMTASVGERSDDEFLHTASYTVKVRNTSSYGVRAQLQQRWFADGFLDDGVWNSFGETTEDPVVTIEAGETFTYEGEQSGIYRWDRTEVRVQPGEFVFFGCGYQPGPGPDVDTAAGD
ncbi:MULTISPECIES: DUF732 domain-containing protein [unclassified Streptomyces]|uniref:DUF732 domain-containing protein n=1 Tax=unclassified Streptomyces TaxID=2593676 RepID=UPI0022548406|nr:MULTISPECIES: DUF732 domain-containing protein [unclassified Streptomyces]MCX4989590.1 DUF732 domain-containing protein [Streptomyces sp. NBC_00568]MCX5005170.1 DUF732 domain-containing protein [Streptomyces sp. NBC_00638]